MIDALFVLLEESCTSSNIAGIYHELEGKLEIWCYKDWCIAEHGFDLSECLLALIIPFKLHYFL